MTTEHSINSIALGDCLVSLDGQWIVEYVDGGTIGLVGKDIGRITVEHEDLDATWVNLGPLAFDWR